MSEANQEVYLVPIIRPINVIDVWEHTPSDYYRRGEYPRYIRPVGPRLGDFDTAMSFHNDQDKPHDQD